MLTVARWLCAAGWPFLLLPSQAWTQGEAPAGTNLRWSYEIRGGILRPDLELFEQFYGDADEVYFSLAATYRVLDWLEVGGELGHMRADGVGILTSSGEPGGEVDYRLIPVHVFVNAVFQRSPRQWLIPYVGAGIATLAYEQQVEQQPDVDGRTDVGYAVRAGLRLPLTSSDPDGTRTMSPSRSRSDWRAYAFIEAQYVSAEADGIDLGGDVYVLGFRMDFDLVP